MRAIAGLHCVREDREVFVYKMLHAIKNEDLRVGSVQYFLS